MHRLDRHAFRVFALTAGLMAITAGGAWATTTGSLRSDRGGELDLLVEVIPDQAEGPLGPFHLQLGADRGTIERTVSLRRQGRLQARGDVYLHTSLAETDLHELLPAPDGLRVLDGDLYFLGDGKSLVEATLIVEATLSRERAITALEQELGQPSFEVVLPGSLSLAIGWRSPGGYLLATFSDLRVFQISAFFDQPTDLLAGSQIVLFEGLDSYSRDKAAGAAEGEISARLEEVVRWVHEARGLLRRIR